MLIEVEVVAVVVDDDDVEDEEELDEGATVSNARSQYARPVIACV